MQKKVKVSVVVPVYNTALYLRDCLDSIIAQTLEEIEIICINNGSTDDSREILQEYADRDKRILIVNQANAGPMGARKTGSRLAKGEYIGYVDSDDRIEKNMYEVLYDIAIQNNADIVSSGYYMEGNYLTRQIDNIQEGLYEGNRLRALREQAFYNFSKRQPGIRAGVCFKLFRKEIIVKAQEEIPNAVHMSEDKLCTIAALLESKRVYISHRIFYHYYLRNNSICHRENEDYLLQVHAVYKCMKKLYLHPEFTPEMRKQSEILIIELLYKGVNTLMGFENANLLWVDPYWMDTMPQGSKILLYGAGPFGAQYRKQILSNSKLQYVACVDNAYTVLNHTNGFQVEDPRTIKQYTFDYILIAIKNMGKAEEIRNQLKEWGYLDDQIKWFDQTEFYWKFIKANGSWDREG